MIMEKLGKAISRYPKTTVVATITLTLIAVGCIQIFGINQEFSEESFLPDIDIVKASEEISSNYTGSYTVSILVKSQATDVLTAKSLVEMLQIEKQIIEDPAIIPLLETPEAPPLNVNSVADIIAQMALLPQNITFPTMDQKISILSTMEDTQIKQLITAILTSDQTPAEIKGLFSIILTKDFNFTAGQLTAHGTIILVSLNASSSSGDTGMHQGAQGDIADAENRMDEIVTATQLTSTKIRVMGNQLINEEIEEASNESMGTLMPIAFALVIIILAVIYRKGLDMFFSLLALIFAIMWVYGFGSAMGYTFNPMTTAVPVLIVGLGIDYGIHITMRYREEIKTGKKLEMAVTKTIATVGMALLLATITTVVAFLSNIVSPLGLLAEFGVLCAIGIIGSFVTMTTFVPACQQLRDQRKLKKGKTLVMTKKQGKGKGRMKGIGIGILNKTMNSGAVAAEKHPLLLILLVGIITLGAMGGVVQLETTFNFEDFLPEDVEIAEDLTYLLNEFEIAGGQAPEVHILVKGDITDPQLIRDMDQTLENLMDTPYIIKNEDIPEIQSILSLMEDWATNSTQYGVYDPSYDPVFETVYSATMTSQGVPRQGTTKQDIMELFDWLYGNPIATKPTKSVLHRADIGMYEGTVLRISVNTDLDDENQIEDLQNHLEEDKKPLEGSSVSSVITGEIIVTKVVMDSLNESQIRSLIITIIMSFIILTFVFWFRNRSFLLGVITLTPLIFCVIWTLGTMFFVNIPLNMMTITVASLTVGLGITYGIHITHRFLEDLEQTKNIADAAQITVTHTGTALFGAATTTIAGFGILAFSIIPPLQQFGAITALTIFFSFLSSVFILPTFLVMWAKWKKKGDSDKVKQGKKVSHQISCPQCNQKVDVRASAKRFKCPHCGFKAEFT